MRCPDFRGCNVHVPVLKAGHLSVLLILCWFVCALQVWVVGSGFPSFLLFLYDYLSYVVCYTHVFPCTQTGCLGQPNVLCLSRCPHSILFRLRDSTEFVVCGSTVAVFFMCTCAVAVHLRLLLCASDAWATQTMPCSLVVEIGSVDMKAMEEGRQEEREEGRKGGREGGMEGGRDTNISYFVSHTSPWNLCLLRQSAFLEDPDIFSLSLQKISPFCWLLHLPCNNWLSNGCSERWERRFIISCR